MNNRDARTHDRGLFTINRIVYYILGILLILLAFRLGFRFFGANPGNAFVSFIYSVTEIFVAPFQNIFGTVTTEGMETEAVFEPSIIIAMIVYSVVAWAIVRLIAIVGGRR
jgi:hypothetical protein